MSNTTKPEKKKKDTHPLMTIVSLVAALFMVIAMSINSGEPSGWPALTFFVLVIAVGCNAVVMFSDGKWVKGALNTLIFVALWPSIYWLPALF